MSEGQAASYTKQVLDALEHLHSLKIAHLDLKVCTFLNIPIPENITELLLMLPETRGAGTRRMVLNIPPIF